MYRPFAEYRTVDCAARLARLRSYASQDLLLRIFKKMDIDSFESCRGKSILLLKLDSTSYGKVELDVLINEVFTRVNFSVNDTFLPSFIRLCLNQEMNYEETTCVGSYIQSNCLSFTVIEPCKDSLLCYWFIQSIVELRDYRRWYSTGNIRACIRIALYILKCNNGENGSLFYYLCTQKALQLIQLILASFNESDKQNEYYAREKITFESVFAGEDTDIVGVLQEISEYCRDIIVRDGMLMSVLVYLRGLRKILSLNAPKNSTALKAKVSTQICASLSGIYMSATSVLIAILNLNAVTLSGDDDIIASQKNSLFQNGVLSIKRMFDLWQQCLNSSSDDYFSGAKGLVRVGSSFDVDKEQAILGIEKALKEDVDTLCFIPTASEAVHKNGHVFEISNHIVSVSKMLLSALFSLSARSSSSSGYCSKCSSFTHILSDHVFNLLVKQCSSGSVSAANISKQVTLKSNFSTTSLQSFSDQDAEAISGSSLYPLLQLVVDLFKLELCHKENNTDIDELKKQVPKNGVYASTNCFQFLKTVFSLAMPGSEQEDLIQKLSNKIQEHRSVPQTPATMFTSANSEIGGDRVVAPLRYALSCVMFRLIGHIGTLFQKDSDNSALLGLAMKNFHTYLLFDVAKKHIRSGLRRIQCSLLSIMEHHVTRRLRTANRQESCSIITNSPTRGLSFEDSEKSDGVVPEDNKADEFADFSDFRVDAKACLENASYVNNLWVVFSAVNHQISRLILGEQFSSSECVCTDSSSELSNSVKFYASYIEVLNHLLEAFVRLHKLSMVLLHSVPNNMIDSCGSKIQLLLGVETPASNGQVWVWGSMLQKLWKFCSESLFSISSEIALILTNVESVRLKCIISGSAYVEQLNKSSCKHKELLVRFSLHSLIAVFNELSAQYCDVANVYSRTDAVEGGLGFLIFPISKCLSMLTEGNHASLPFVTSYSYAGFCNDLSDICVSLMNDNLIYGSNGSTVDLSVEFHQLWSILLIACQTEVFRSSENFSSIIENLYAGSNLLNWGNSFKVIAKNSPSILILDSKLFKKFETHCSENFTKIHENKDNFLLTSKAANSCLFSFGKKLSLNFVREYIKNIISSKDDLSLVSSDLKLTNSSVDIDSIPNGLIFYLYSLLVLEELRVQENFDFRHLILYLECIPNISSDYVQSITKNILEVSCVHFFNMWLRCISFARLQRLSVDDALGEDLMTDSPLLHPLLNVIRSLFSFCAVRMVSSTRAVSVVSRYYVERMCNAFSWLRCDKYSMFALLDGLQYATKGNIQDIEESRPLSYVNSLGPLPNLVDVDNSCNIASLCNPWVPKFYSMKTDFSYVRLVNKDTAKYSKIFKLQMRKMSLLKDVLVLVYYILTNGKDNDIFHGILEDYLLKLSGFECKLYDSDLGYQLAKELQTYGKPSFHLRSDIQSALSGMTLESRSFASSYKAMDSESILDVIRQTASLQAYKLCVAVIESCSKPKVVNLAGLSLRVNAIKEVRRKLLNGKAFSIVKSVSPKSDNGSSMARNRSVSWNGAPPNFSSVYGDSLIQCGEEILTQIHSTTVFDCALSIESVNIFCSVLREATVVVKEIVGFIGRVLAIRSGNLMRERVVPVQFQEILKDLVKRLMNACFVESYVRFYWSVSVVQTIISCMKWLALSCNGNGFSLWDANFSSEIEYESGFTAPDDDVHAQLLSSYFASETISSKFVMEFQFLTIQDLLRFAFTALRFTQQLGFGIFSTPCVASKPTKSDVVYDCASHFSLDSTFAEYFNRGGLADVHVVADARLQQYSSGEGHEILLNFIECMLKHYPGTQSDILADLGHILSTWANNCHLSALETVKDHWSSIGVKFHLLKLSLSIIDNSFGTSREAVIKPHNRRIIRENILLVATNLFNVKPIYQRCGHRDYHNWVNVTTVKDVIYKENCNLINILCSCWSIHEFFCEVEKDLIYWSIDYHNGCISWFDNQKFFIGLVRPITEGMLDDINNSGKGEIVGEPYLTDDLNDRAIFHSVWQNFAVLSRRHKILGMVNNGCSELLLPLATTQGMKTLAKVVGSEECGIYNSLKLLIIDEIARAISWCFPGGISKIGWKSLFSSSAKCLDLKFLPSCYVTDIESLWSGLSENDVQTFKKYLDSYEKLTMASVATKDLLVYKICIRSLWIFNPYLSVYLHDRFPNFADRDGRRKGCSVLGQLFCMNVRSLCYNPISILYLQTAPFSLLNEEQYSSGRRDFLSYYSQAANAAGNANYSPLCRLVSWPESSAVYCLELLNRSRAYDHQVEVLSSHLSHSLFASTNSGNNLHCSPSVVYYCIRSINSLSVPVVLFYLPQFVQLLRRDIFGGFALLISELSSYSASICHQVMWLLQTESVGVGDGGEHGKEKRKKSLFSKDLSKLHGLCHQLHGSDPLPVLARSLIFRIRDCLPKEALLYMDNECGYFSQITHISAILKLEKDKTKHNLLIHDAIAELGPIPGGLYLPVMGSQKVISIDSKSGAPMQSAAKCPYLLFFNTVPWEGPDNYKNILPAIESNAENGKGATLSAGSILKNGTKVPYISKSMAMEDLLSSDEEDDIPVSSTAVRVAPTNLSIRRDKSIAKTSSGGFVAPKVMKTNFAEIELKPVSAEADEKVDSNLRISICERNACIFKVYDDCRQDALTIQLIKLMKCVYEDLSLPLHLVPYSVIPSRTGPDHAVGGILEVIKNVYSRDQLGRKLGMKTLKFYFLQKFGSVDSDAYLRAKRCFMSSVAAYGVICYLLWVKDRHNGNILIDDMGHSIHIDFGFLLGISPGGNLGFETAAFKFSKEMIELLDGIHSETFEIFTKLCIRAFLVARQHMNHILPLVAAFADSGLPCFNYKSNVLDGFQARFFPKSNDVEAALKMRGLIYDAADKWTTSAYDGIQKVQNNIYSDYWH